MRQARIQLIKKMLSAWTLMSSAVLSQPPKLVIQERSTPQVGTEQVATAGTVILEQYRFVGRLGVRVKAPVSANWGNAENVDLVTDDGLAIIREKRLKACREFRIVMGIPGWDDCLIDIDDDGKFDRVSFNDVGGSKDLNPPVAYERSLVEMKGEPGRGVSPNFRQQIVFTGAAGSSLMLSYREYTDDLARPAFTESLVLPLSAAYPQKLAVKQYTIEIISIDGLGMKYRLEK